MDHYLDRHLLHWLRNCQNRQQPVGRPIGRSLFCQKDLSVLPYTNGVGCPVTGRAGKQSMGRPGLFVLPGRVRLAYVRLHNGLVGGVAWSYAFWCHQKHGDHGGRICLCDRTTSNWKLFGK